MTTVAAGMRPSRTVVRILRATLVGGAMFVVLVGLLHTKAGRPLLAKLGQLGCPIRAGTAAEVDRARAFGAAAFAGKALAPSRPALGFDLERTTLRDFEAWAKAHALSCDTIRGTETLRSCTDVPAEAIGQPEWFGPAEEVTFEFRADRTLAVVATMRRRLPASRANAITTEIGRRLNGVLGTPSVRGGANDPAHFAKGPIQAFKEEWAFGDYGATLSEVRLADTGIMVREQYLTL